MHAFAIWTNGQTVIPVDILKSVQSFLLHLVIFNIIHLYTQRIMTEDLTVYGQIFSTAHILLR